ncbi:hypothetical protein P4644_23840 [Priestia aryabhattai]|uniref:hypothetical protein n=1 Tax=Priestia aryabhattai TaxID=412384 RepID=UPI002E1FC397|nr:hypothetical protein [Priestia aryabhattai]
MFKSGKKTYLLGILTFAIGFGLWIPDDSPKVLDILGIILIVVGILILLLSSFQKIFNKDSK